MKKYYIVNLALPIILTLISLAYIFSREEPIKLGLDLKGGVLLTLGVDIEKAIESNIEKSALMIKDVLERTKIDVDEVKVKDNSITIKVLISNEVDKAISEIEKMGIYIIKSEGGNEISIFLSNKEIERIKKNTIDQVLSVIKNRIDQFGVAEVDIRKAGEDKIIIALPGLKNPERALNIIGKTARLEFRLLDEEHNVNSLSNSSIPEGSEILYGRVVDRKTKREINVPYLVKNDVLLTGEHIVDARVMVDSMRNEPYVALQFDPIGAKIFEKITSENVGRRLAIILDNVVYSAPVIREPITGGRASITGSFSYEEAHDLAIVLRAGTLPAPVTVLEMRTIGPSLGEDSIKTGIKATIVGVTLVYIFMAIYYQLAGFLADLSMVSCLLIILGAMSAFGATLTLPGIAGLALTTAMALDSNVIIFERIREELRLGRTIRNAIDAGFSRATITVLDTHITTLISSLILFEYGTGPVKGFAVTMGIGLIASLITSILLTRGLIEVVISTFKLKKLPI
jgi:preprotein translocase subunit SecD